MNDPYNGNGRKSPEDDLGRSIEKEVKETIGTVAPRCRTPREK